MSALLVLWGGKDCGNYPPRAEIRIIIEKMRVEGKVVKTLLIETPLIMGPEFAAHIANLLDITPLSLRIALNDKQDTWLTKYDRKGDRPERRIRRILRKSPSVLRIRELVLPNDPEATREKRA